MLQQDYEGNVMKNTAFYEWYIFVKDEKVTKRVQDYQKTSRTEENIAKVSQFARENRRLTVRSIAVQVNIDRETGKSTLKIMTKGGLSKIKQHCMLGFI